MANEFLKTALFSRHQPGGLFGVINEEVTNKDIVFVSSVTGTDGAGYGRSPDSPVATLDYAVSLNANPKRIILLPRHAESLAAATSAAVDVADTEIIGMGVGSEIPTFTLGTATTATIAVTAANCRFRNIKIISDLANVAAGITASAAADGLTVEDCWLADGAAAKELVIGISLATGCDNVTIRRTKFTATDTGDCASAIKFVGTTVDSVIEDCKIHGDYSVACIDNATGAATRTYIMRNVLWNTDAAAGLAISANAGSTGAVVYNHAFGGKDGTSPMSACAGFLVSQNYASNAAGASGIILPAVDS